MEVVQTIKFDAVMTYDDWTVFKYKDKYYVANEDEIKEVVLVKKMEAEDYYANEDYDVVDFGCSYNGESDDMQC